MNAEPSAIRILPLEGLPEVAAGADLVPLLLRSLELSGIALEPGDVLVLCQKIVSKSEGRIVARDAVEVTEKARALAERLGKDPVKVAVILSESRRVVRAEWPVGKPEGVLICEHRQGFVCANAGVDESNAGGRDLFVLLPEDADASAERIRADLARAAGVAPGIVITDSFGRPWRLGIVNVAIGAAGLPVLVDVRGCEDPDGRKLNASVLAVADEVAAAAGLVMGKLERVPAALVRGMRQNGRPGCARDMIRAEKEDVFR